MKTILYYLLVVPLLFSCRKKEVQDRAAPEPENDVIVKARNWYNNRPVIKNTNEVQQPSRYGPFRENIKVKPKWSAAKMIKNLNSTVVQVPIDYENNRSFAIKTGSGSGESLIEGQSSMLIVKGNFYDTMYARVLHVYPEGGKLKENFSYNRIPGDFTGSIYYTDLEGNFISGSKYRNGLKTKYSVMQPASDARGNVVENNSSRVMAAKWPPDGCETVPQDWYQRECTYYSDGSVWCSEWRYAYTIYIVDCGGGGGSGDAGVENPGDGSRCCVADLANVMMSSASINSIESFLCGRERVNMITGRYEKTCAISIEFNTNKLLWYTWSWIMHSVNVLEKIDDTWYFKRVDPPTYTKNGSEAPCTTASIHVALALPGIYDNNRKASMTLAYESRLRISDPCCRDCAPMSQTYSSTYRWNTDGQSTY